MATIQSQLRLNDGMTTQIRNITTAMDTCISSFEQMQAVSSQSIDVANINAANSMLSETDGIVDDIKGKLEQITEKQGGVNEAIRSGSTAADGLLGKLVQIAAAYASMQTVQKLFNLSDEMSGLDARLNFIVDDGGSVDELRGKIMAIANTTGAAYQSTADTIARLGANAGDAFGSNNELIAFADQLNKSFVIAGTSGQAAESVMYNLTQALSSGVLKGQDLNSVLSNAPNVVHNIADYLGVSMGEIREMAAEGQITADIVKNAMFAAASDTNAAFEEMPLRWEQLWNIASNNILANSQPFLEKLSQGAQWVADNWGRIAPILTPVAVAIGAVAIALGVATIAQKLFNTALWASPITWIVAAVVGIIVGIYLLVDAINKAQGTSISATGIIFGAFAVLGAFLWNLFLGLLDLVLGVINRFINPFIRIANFIGNVFHSPVSSIIYLFQSMADEVLATLQKIASAIDFVLGTNMADAVAGWREDLKSLADDLVKEYAPNENYQQIMSELDLSAEDLGLKRWEYSDAWSSGYAAGEGLEGTIGNLFNYDTSMQDDPSQYLGDIEKNTDSTATSLKNMSEDLVYLRDLAERDAINRYTTAEIKIDWTMSNRIDGSVDLDGVIRQMADGLEEIMISSAEAVHA